MNLQINYVKNKTILDYFILEFCLNFFCQQLQIIFNEFKVVFVKIKQHFESDMAFLYCLFSQTIWQNFFWCHWKINCLNESQPFYSFKTHLIWKISIWKKLIRSLKFLWWNTLTIFTYLIYWNVNLSTRKNYISISS